MVQQPDRADQPAHPHRHRHSEPCNWAIWYSFCGKKKVWLAITIEARTKAPPPTPKTTKPGRTRISVNRHDAAGNKERHFQPAGGALKETAPEKEGEGHDGDEGADAGARRVQPM